MKTKLVKAEAAERIEKWYGSYSVSRRHCLVPFLFPPFHAARRLVKWRGPYESAMYNFIFNVELNCDTKKCSPDEHKSFTSIIKKIVVF